MQIDRGERVCLIGRNGAGKTTLLRVASGEQPPDAGTRWLQPGVRVARLEQDVPLSTTAPVFDVVAEGLGEVSALVTAYHHAAVEVARDHSPRALERLAQAQHQLDEQDGWNVEQRVETVLARLGLPADAPVDTLSGGWRRRTLLARALVARARPAAARRADQSPRHRGHHLARSAAGRLRRRGALHHPRPRVPAASGHPHRRARSRAPHVLARRLRDLPAPQGGGAGRRSHAAAEVRQEAGRRGSVAAPGRQGPAHAQRRPRARADGDACRARQRAAPRRAWCGCRPARPRPAASWCSRPIGSPSASAARRSCATSRAA